MIRLLAVLMTAPLVVASAQEAFQPPSGNIQCKLFEGWPRCANGDGRSRLPFAARKALAHGVAWVDHSARHRITFPAMMPKPI